MARSGRFTSFREKIAFNSAQQRSKAANFGHLMLPRGVPVFKEEPATRIGLDFLPYTVSDPNHPDKDEEREIAVKGSPWYKRPYRVHRNVGAENTTMVCPTSVGRKCPICEHRTKLLNEGANWQDDTVKALRPSERVLYYVIPKGHKKYEERPHVWDMSKFLFQDKLNDELEENDQYGDFPDPQNGYTLKIRFSSEKIGNNAFADTSRIDFEQRDYAYDEQNLPSLDDMVVVKEYRDVAQAFFGTEGEEGETGDVDVEAMDNIAPKPVTRPKAAPPSTGNGQQRPVRTRQMAPVEDPPEEDEEDNEESDPTPSVYNRPKAQSMQRGAPALQRGEPAAAPVAAKPQRQVLAGAEQCPFGHRFGEDCDKTDDCEECTIWSACNSAMTAA